DRLRDDLERLRPWLGATAVVLPPLREAVVRFRDGPPATWSEGLFELSRSITTPACDVTVDLDDETIARLINEKFGTGADDPDTPPPSMAALHRLRRSTEDRATLDTELVERWARRDTPGDPDYLRIAHSCHALLQASYSNWETCYQQYRDSDPWLALIAAAPSAELTDKPELTTPGLDAEANQADNWPPLDR